MVKSSPCSGSSPRGRGMRKSGACLPVHLRFIPAWAGNAIRSGAEAGRPPVHPRVGGECAVSQLGGAIGDGSSPRGRGMLLPVPRQRQRSQFIPAWAGNACGWCASKAGGAVHPRVGGECGYGKRGVKLFRGSSPRGRGMPRPRRCRPRLCRFIPAWAGNALNDADECDNSHGSSPRGRGMRDKSSRGVTAPRFIPAWAGNAENPTACSRTLPVHPRVGGECGFGVQSHRGCLGSSPRGRGMPARRHGQDSARRFIPAWAGNASRSWSRPWRFSVHPRVGGECDDGGGLLDADAGSSPRGRGMRTEGITGQSPRRFIPAWAGNACLPRRRHYALPVHPRVGGECGDSGASDRAHSGSSPRGRGMRRTGRLPWPRPRFIPAWAGNAKNGTAALASATVHPRVGGECSFFAGPRR